jgi:hypothetical protein
MIGATGRGVIAGGEEARNHSHALPDDEIRCIAARVLAWMRTNGYAHLDPEEEFICSFVVSFRQALAFRSASL